MHKIILTGWYRKQGTPAGIRVYRNIQIKVLQPIICVSCIKSLTLGRDSVVFMKCTPHHNLLSELTLRLKNDDKEAFREVYELYHPKLFHFSLKFTHSQEATQEIIQDVFLKLWTHRKSLQPGLSLQNYLYTLNKHENFRYLNRAAHHLPLQEEIIQRHETVRNPVEEEVIYEEYMGIAEEAIEKLPPQRQLIFKMFRYEGHSSKEIAQALGISNHTVRSQLVKATHHIKEYFYLHTGITLTLVLSVLVFLL